MWVVIGVQKGRVKKDSVRVFESEKQAQAWRNHIDESLDITRESDSVTAPIGNYCEMLELIVKKRESY